MVHRSMMNGSRVADEFYILRVLLALEDFLFFSIYSFACIAKPVVILKQLQLMSCCDPSRRTSSALVSFTISHDFLPISLAPDSARYTRMSLTISHLILNAPTSLGRA